MGVSAGIRPTRETSRTCRAGARPAEPGGVIGISRAQWGLIAAALALGGNVRVGLEDNFYLPDGEMARSNGELVARGGADGGGIGRRFATLAEARAIARAVSGESAKRFSSGRSSGRSPLARTGLSWSWARGASRRPSGLAGRGTRSHQHAGPPSALLIGALERTVAREDMVLARITVEILGRGPDRRAGGRRRRSSGRAARSSCSRASCAPTARAVLRARAWRVLRLTRRARDDGPRRLALPEADDAPPPLLGEAFGYAHAVEWRWARGGLGGARAGGGLDADADPAGRGRGAVAAPARDGRRRLRQRRLQRARLEHATCSSTPS